MFGKSANGGFESIFVDVIDQVDDAVLSPADPQLMEQVDDSCFIH